jgi:hypothetical protein
MPKTKYKVIIYWSDEDQLSLLTSLNFQRVRLMERRIAKL